MRTFEIGLVLPAEESWVDGATPRWTDIRDFALRAETLGFDTVWVPDELLWRPAGGRVTGWWEGVALTGAVAATTSRIKVGTWVMSALHRNPGITAKAVETLDEVSGGRFVFAPGSGVARARGPEVFQFQANWVNFGRTKEVLKRESGPLPGRCRAVCAVL
jgi:alkanesulfonate monooxygenase SsuD/methylene tetrahydromethanopterin reductase-like flavin-dependent oxidoreductase (luciferase family)